MNMEQRGEALMNKPLYVVDFLPEQVPEHSRGQFFAVEEYFLDEEEDRRLFRRFLRILLKLNCYYDFTVDRDGVERKNPSPKKLKKWVRACREGEQEYLRVFLNDGETMLSLHTGELCMGVFNPDEHLRALLEQLAGAEGLFFWQNHKWL